ncbi:hypothetical protein H6758_03430 [Candidatus Nomurabacteria bacterium]|nr:hypothetical protein [Candidatus Nomurabacteria bacterium]
MDVTFSMGLFAFVGVGLLYWSIREEDQEVRNVCFFLGMIFLLKAFDTIMALAGVLLFRFLTGIGFLLLWVLALRHLGILTMPQIRSVIRRIRKK